MTHQLYVWDFTYFLPEDNMWTIDRSRNYLKEISKTYCFQLEKGEESNKLHYQGRFSLKSKMRHATLVKQFNEAEWNNVCLSPTSEVNKTNMFYVMKPESRVDGPWSDKNEPMFIPRQFQEVIDKGLKPWQRHIVEDVEFDSRIINLIYDPKGGIGKTSVMGILGSQGLAEILPPLNDYKDLMRMVCDLPTAKKYIIDMPRAINQTKVEGLYSALENIKAGWVFDDRYSTKRKWFDSPILWVFCNRLPNMDLLTTNRWKIWVVNNQDELQPYV